MFAAKISRELKNSGIYLRHQQIRLGRLEIHIVFSNPNIDVRILAQGYCDAGADPGFFSGGGAEYQLY